MHRNLRVGVIDLTTKTLSWTLHSRVMLANFASIMPKAITAWCEEEGHEVKFLEQIPTCISHIWAGCSDS